jgi:hypothetical protein
MAEGAPAIFSAIVDAIFARYTGNCIDTQEVAATGTNQRDLSP